MRVLVVEGDAAVRHVVDAILSRSGHHVITAASADLANAQLLDLQHTPEVALLAIVLPGLNGPTYAGQLRRQFSALRIVFMTGWLDAGLISEAETYGPVLFKPFHVDELLLAIGHASSV